MTLLSLEDVEQFFRIHKSLMFFVNQRLKVVDKKVASPEAYAKLAPETRIKVHQALIEHIDLIDAFADENPFKFPKEDLEIVRSWKHLVSGTFYIFRYLKTHAIFLTDGEPAVAYGVLPLFDPFEEMIWPDELPRMVKTTLLPFKGRIVYDGLLNGYNVSFGAGVKRSLNESYKEAKEGDGVITSLPPSPAALPAVGKARAGSPKTKTKAKAKGGSPAAAAAREAHDRIVALIDDFCRQHLNDEYAEMSRKLAGVLSRKRPSPITKGKAESWASGIVRVIGWANFLGDPSQDPHMKMSDVDKGFGVSEATGSAKATAIRKLLHLDGLSVEWTLPSRMDDNPLIWMLQVNGLLVDIRRCPREAQVVAYKQGLIPYIPADRE